jgi:acyl transferase domain-containing protein/NADPH:quinone reductase-like Zn-dependent oxidoreductase/NAD(P)-dependent dehydrogenase (short-subunit alcohol dehydrogenase family)
MLISPAGIPLEKVAGSQTSVFCGSFTNDYNSTITKDLEYYPKYTITGTGNSILSNRISYFYNLHGASATIDTACSSSLVCFHLGNQTLQAGEASMSIILGSALHFDPNIFITMTDLGMLSTDGRCRAFDADGTGYVRGEGICAIILKRKSQAELDGDFIRAIVRGTGVNHDGTKQGITLPSSESQEALIRQVYRTAGLDPRDTSYFEAHGTGTRAGDPRETRAIGAVFAPDRDDYLHLGSVKSNIGHLEGASGVAALIKATLSLERGKILPNMHFNTPNPNIKFDEWKLKVPTKTLDWDAPSGFRRASINSFGYGGTNGHVILEGYYASQNKPWEKLDLTFDLEKMTQKRPFLFPLTSHSVKTGKLTGVAFSNYVEERPELDIRDLAYTLSLRRSMHKFRSFAVSSDADTLLGDFADPLPVAAWTAAQSQKPRIGFVFTGQGGQWFAMGRELIQKSPLFKQTLQRCDEILGQLPDAPEWSVVEELLKSQATSRLGETQFSQPLCTALQLALCTLLNQWGIEPTAVVGHSSGEMGAAYAAGILSFENALIAAYYRGLYMSSGPENSVKGSMMAVGLTEEEARLEIEPYKGRIALAAINSPSSITLSGDEDAIVDLKKDLVDRKVFARQLQVAQAFHSHHMSPLAPGYLQALEKHTKFSTLPAQRHMFSSVTARAAQPSLMGPQYWVDNMVGTVRFSEALSGILVDEEGNQAVDVLMEIGPHPALKGPSRQTVQSLKLDIPYLNSLTRGTLDYEGLLTAAGQLFALGYPVDLAAVNSDHFLDESGVIQEVNKAQRLRDMPKYCWDHSGRYWADTRVISEHRLRKHRHAILGAPVVGSVPGSPRWRNFLRLDELPWLADHKIDGDVVFPAAGYIAMAIEAIARLEDGPASISQFALRDVSIQSALVLDGSAMGKEVILDLRPHSTSTKPTPDAWYEFSIISFGSSGADNTEHCRGLVSVQEGSAESIDRKQPYFSFAELQAKSVKSLVPRTFYERIHSLGLQYGESFALLTGRIESGAGFATAPLSWDSDKFNSPAPSHATLVHPSLLDAALHTIFAAVEGRTGKPITGPYVPTFLRSLQVSGVFAENSFLAADHEFQVSTEVDLQGPRLVTSDLRLQSEDGQQLLLDIQGLELTGLGTSDVPSRSLFFRTNWDVAFEFLNRPHAPIPDSLARLVEIFAHQFPDSKILHITPTPDSSREVLRLLGGRDGEQRRFHSLTLLPVSEDNVSSAEQIQSEWPSLITLEEPKEGEYDLVILDDAALQTHNVATYLNTGAFVISLGDRDISEEALTPVFSSKCFKVWRKAVASSNPISGTDLALITAANSSERTVSIASTIASAHAGRSFRISIDQFSQITPTPENVVILAALDKNILFNETPSDTEDFINMQHILTTGKRNVVMVLNGASMDSQKPEQALMTGLARTARSENEELRLVLLDTSSTAQDAEVSSLITQILNPQIQEDELTERDGAVFIPRVQADETLNSKLTHGSAQSATLQPLDQDRQLALKISKVGALDTLVFDDDLDLQSSRLANDEVEIKVQASVISSRDSAVIRGAVAESKLGDVCAGLVLRIGKDVDPTLFQTGDRVVAVRPGQGAHRTIVRNPVSWTYRLKDEMALSTAAAIPAPLITAYEAIHQVAHLRAGETILIRSAAGQVGRMAIQVARRVGATVFVTAGSESEQTFLQEACGLEAICIFSSADTSFAQQILDATNGKGVDVVLNDLSGKSIAATLSCLSPGGRFVDLGVNDLLRDIEVVDAFRKHIMLASVNTGSLFEDRFMYGAKMMKECWELATIGVIGVLGDTVELPYSDVVKGFQMAQDPNFHGTVVLKPDIDDVVRVLPTTYRDNALFNPNKTHLLVGGLGGLGRTLAEFLLRRGARSLAFLSRSGADHPEAQLTLDWLQERGVQTSVYRGDVTDFSAVQSCIDAIGSRLAGVFHAAVVLQDSPYDKMTFDQWQKCLKPKVHGALNLHRATRAIQLEYFVCFSSVSSVFGGKGLANYAAANCYLDALMRHRCQAGLAGTAIDAGMVVGIGLVAQNAALQQTMERMGFDPVTEQEFLYQIEEAVVQGQLASSQSLIAPGIDQTSTITGLKMSPDVFWSQRPLFRNLYSNYDFGDHATGGSVVKELAAHIRSISNAEERSAIMTEAFVEKISAVLGIATESITPSNALSAYGLDSIVAVEFRRWFTKVVEVDLSLFDVLGAASISALLAKALELVAIEA